MCDASWSYLLHVAEYRNTRNCLGVGIFHCLHKWLGTAYNGPWSVGYLQAKMVRRLLTGAGTSFCLQMPRPRRLLTTAQGLKRPWPSSAYSPSAAYKLGPGQAGRCLQSNRCLQARAGPSRPLLTVQPLLTSPVRAEPAAAYSPTAAYKPGPGRAGRCLQSNRCLQAYTGKLMPPVAWRARAPVRCRHLLTDHRDTGCLQRVPGVSLCLQRNGT